MPRIFVAASWPYANGPIHIGQFASTYLPADIFARYHRLKGNEVLMVSGSDMHGTPLLVRAEEESTTPEAIARRYHAVHKTTFSRAGISFDLYTDTHTVNHERTVDEMFLTLLENGYIRRRTEEGPYCPQHRRFLPDRYALGTCPHCGFPDARGDECDHCGRPINIRQLGSPRCALCGTPAEFRPSEHFYLELDKLESAVAEFVDARPHWRAGTRRVAENFLSEGLHPTPITRDLDWGVPIPLDGYDGKVFYVWFEALIGYLSAAREWAIRAGRPDAWHRYWDVSEPVRQYYFVGKDNRFHHTIEWPAMLLGAQGLQVPYDVPANEWMNLGGQKVSKSRMKEFDVFVPSLLDRYPVDVVRFYAALLAPQNHDTDFDADEFERLRDEILSNQLGNLVQRTLVLARDKHGNRIPQPPPSWSSTEADGVGSHLVGAHTRIEEEYEAVHLKEALDLVLEEVREANRAFHEAKPWSLDPAEQARVLYETIWRLKAIATWLAPTLPTTSERILTMIGSDGPLADGRWEQALQPPTPGQTLGKVEPLFPRASAAPGSAAAPTPGPTRAPPPLAIRVGIVRVAEPHPEADRLLVLTVDLGEPHPRTIVAGIRGAYAPEQLIGRRIVVLANLAHRTIRRKTSQGMLLASEIDGRPVLLSPPDGLPAGASIDGTPEPAPQISIDDLGRAPLVIGQVEGPADKGGSRVRLKDRSIAATGSAPPGSLVVVRLAAPDAAAGSILTFGQAGPIRPSEPVAAGAVVR